MRGGFRIKPIGNESHSASPYTSTRPSWMEEFLSKVAVQPVSQEVKAENYSKMYAIMNGHRPNARYSSVEEAVKDYQKKTGLDDYLKTIKAEEAASKIVKSAEVSLFVKHPYLKSLTDSIISQSVKVGDDRVMTVLSTLENNFPNVNQQEIHAADVQKYISEGLANIQNNQESRDVHALSGALNAPPQDVLNADPFQHMRSR